MGYWCDPCGRTFLNVHALEQHEENSIQHLNKVWTYVCEPCKWGCDRKKLMENHDVEFHNWCKEHDRFFRTESDLRQHNMSKAHGQTKQCPFCNRVFPTVTGISLHLESGSCEGGMTRLKVDKQVHEVDRRGVITNRRRIAYGDWEPEPDIWATESAWNGEAFECYFCDRECKSLGGLNAHITQVHAPKRTEDIYNCPGCGRQFKLFSQLVGHVEHTGTCSVKENRGLKGMLVGGVSRKRLTMA